MIFQASSSVYTLFKSKSCEADIRAMAAVTCTLNKENGSYSDSLSDCSEKLRASHITRGTITQITHLAM